MVTSKDTWMKIYGSYPNKWGGVSRYNWEEELELSIYVDEFNQVVYTLSLKPRRPTKNEKLNQYFSMKYQGASIQEALDVFNENWLFPRLNLCKSRGWNYYLLADKTPEMALQKWPGK